MDDRSFEFHRRKNQLWWYLYDRGLRAKLGSLGALLPEWRAIKAGSSLKNLSKFAGRFFRLG